MNWMDRQESDAVPTFALHNALGRPSIPPATHDLAATSPRSWIYTTDNKKMEKKNKRKEKERKKRKHLNIILKNYIKFSKFRMKGTKGNADKISIVVQSSSHIQLFRSHGQQLTWKVNVHL